MPKTANIKVTRSGGNNVITVQNFTAGDRINIFRSNQHNTAFEQIVSLGLVDEYNDPASSNRKYKGQIVDGGATEVINTSTEVINTSEAYLFNPTSGSKSISVFTKQ